MTQETYAAITDNTITHLSGPIAADHEAQAWHRGLRSPGKLVVLDLAEGERARIGDAVDVDEDGVATLAGGAQ